MSVKIKLLEIFDNQSKSLMAWAKGLEKVLERIAQKDIVATNQFVNRIIQREIDKFYGIIQDAVDDVDELLIENGLQELTSEWEKNILEKLQNDLTAYRVDCRRIYEVYKNVLLLTSDEIHTELKTICFDIRPEDMLKIVKDFLYGKK